MRFGVVRPLGLAAAAAFAALLAGCDAGHPTAPEPPQLRKVVRPPQAPQAPTGVDAVPLLSTRVDVFWTDASSDETGFRVERSTDGGTTWALAAQLVAGAVALVDESRTPEQRVCYRVLAVNGSLQSVPSAVDCTTPAAAVSNIAAALAADGSISLTWVDNSAVETGFTVTRSVDGNFPTPTDVGTVGANATSFRDTPPAGAARYGYRIRPLTDGGSGTWSDEVTVWMSGDGRPPAPSNLVVVQSVFAASYASLTWAYGSIDRMTFRVEWAPGTNGPWSVPPNLSVNGLRASVKHDFERYACYRVIATSGDVASDPSNVDCLALPAMPDALSARAVDGATIDVSWVDKSSIESGFELRRTASVGSDTAWITVAANVTTYRDGELAANVRYDYWIRARSPDGVSEFRAGASATTATTPPATPAGLEVVPYGYGVVDPGAPMYVSWQRNASLTDGYRVERSTDGGASWRTVATGWASFQYWDDGTDLQAEAEVCYRVSAMNVAGDSPPTAPDCTAYPRQPTVLSWVETDGVTEITWRDNSNVEEHYELRRYYLESGYDVVAVLPANSTSLRIALSPDRYHELVAVRDGGPARQEP